MAECNHDCGNCASKCGEEKTSFLEEQNSMSNVKNVIAVVSGKGGVGKSLITSLLAVAARRKGYETAILDADIPRFLVEVGQKVAASGMDFDHWYAANSDVFAAIAQTYID